MKPRDLIEEGRIAMTDETLHTWFNANKTLLENAYIVAQQPWQQSGFGLHTSRTYQDWKALRKSIADCMDTSGTFLDIGCAKYRGHEQEATPVVGVDKHLTKLGFNVECFEIGMLGGVEKTRVAVVRKS